MGFRDLRFPFWVSIMSPYSGRNAYGNFHILACLSLLFLFCSWWSTLLLVGKRKWLPVISCPYIAHCENTTFVHFLHALAQYGCDLDITWDPGPGVLTYEV